MAAVLLLRKNEISFPFSQSGTPKEQYRVDLVERRTKAISMALQTDMT